MMKLNIQMFASTNKTANYELPQFVGTDKPSWLGDVNGAMSAIDTGMHTNATTIAGVQSTIQTLSASVDSTNQSVTSLSNSLDTLDGRVTTLENDNSINKAKIETNSTYSTDEIKVGTWIDGKPLYRRVIKVTDIDRDKNNIDIPISINNLNEIVNIGGTIKLSGMNTYKPITVIYTDSSNTIDSHYNFGVYAITNSYISLSYGNWWKEIFDKAYISLEYTKTTD